MVSHPTTSDGASRRRIVLLGASNVTLNFPRLMTTLRAAYREPLEVFAAHGHGRSYGMRSRILGRELPGIAQSGLFDAIAQAPDAPPSVLLTDFGNDILYGASTDQIVGWISQVLDNLKPHRPRLVMTELPIASVAGLGPKRFRICRQVLFPRCRLTLEQVRIAAESLNREVQRLAAAHSARLIAPRREWYGLDPIHILPKHRNAAWAEILRSWTDGGETFPVRTPTFAERVRYWSLRPEERRLWGFQQTAAQPVVHGNEDFHLSLF